MKVTEKEAQEFCADCNEICSRHCVIWRKAEMREEIETITTEDKEEHHEEIK